MAKRKVSRTETLGTVSRKILFYRANCGVDESGKPLAFDVTPALQAIDRLPFDTQGRYLESSSGPATCCWADDCQPPQRLRLGSIRRGGLPQLEKAGQLTSLEIPPDSGLVEFIHVMFFPGNIVGAEFNFYGPRMSRLSYYLRRKTGLPEVTFEALLRGDIMAKLSRLQELRLFDLKVRASYADIVAQASEDLGSALKAAAKAGKAEEVEVLLRPKSRSPEFLSNGLLGVAKRLLRRGNIREEISKFQVRGLDPDTHKVETVDVLSDALISQQEVMLEDPRTRAINAESAYTAIERAYEELRSDLINAAGVDA